MDNPGLKNLGDVALAAINAATVATVVTTSSDDSGNTVAYIDGLEGMLGLTLQANWNWSAGGTSVKVDVEVSCDQGSTWVPIARFAFATASAEKLFNISGLTPKLAAVTPATLADDTALDGVLGDRMRARITTVGTFSGNTSLSLRAACR
jgi:hypothetical protein